MDTDTVDGGEFTPRERAHLRHRDRKRVTVMVVDNAGIKRVAQALSRRRHPAAEKPPPAS